MPLPDSFPVLASPVGRCAMSMNNPIADMLTRIRNAGLANLETVEIDSSKIKLHITEILKQQGYIGGYITQHHQGRGILHLEMKYDAHRRPVIRGLKVLSKPGRRIYAGFENLPSVRNNYGTLIVSTSSGVITGAEARRKKVGGELICAVW